MEGSWGVLLFDMNLSGIEVGEGIGDVPLCGLRFGVRGASLLDAVEDVNGGRGTGFRGKGNESMTSLEPSL